MNLIIKIIQQNNMKKILSTIGIIGVIAVAVYTTYLATGGTGGELLSGELSDTSGADGTGNTFTLTDVNAECVRLEVSASSTELWTQLKLR